MNFFQAYNSKKHGLNLLQCKKLKKHACNVLQLKEAKKNMRLIFCMLEKVFKKQFGTIERDQHTYIYNLQVLPLFLFISIN